MANAATRARNVASSACTEPARAEPGVGPVLVACRGGLGAALVMPSSEVLVVSGSSEATQVARVPRVIPRSVAIPRRPAPGVHR